MWAWTSPTATSAVSYTHLDVYKRQAYKHFYAYLGGRADAPLRLITKADIKGFVAAGTQLFQRHCQRSPGRRLHLRVRLQLSEQGMDLPLLHHAGRQLLHDQLSGGLRQDGQPRRDVYKRQIVPTG